MGIFRFFRHISKNYREALICYKKNQPSVDTSTDACLIDLNAVFHPCCQVMYEYGNGEKTKSIFWSNKKKEMTPEEKEILHRLHSKAQRYQTAAEGKKGKKTPEQAALDSEDDQEVSHVDVYAANLSLLRR